MRLEVGAEAPFFSGTDDEGRQVTLDDFAGNSLVLYFYPKAFTPGCTTEACEFRDRHETLYAAGYEILGVSPDPPDKLAAFREEHELPFHLLSDEDQSMAQAYGAWGVKKNYGREYEGLIRSTFIIGADGTIEHAWYNVQAKGHAERVTKDLASA